MVAVAHGDVLRWRSGAGEKTSRGEERPGGSVALSGVDSTEGKGGQAGRSVACMRALAVPFFASSWQGGG